MQNKNLIVKKSRNGKGLFTNRIFLKDAIILKVTGRLITCEVDKDLDEETRNNTYRWEMKCNCGSMKCRHIIGKFKSLPKKIKEKYISLKIVPSYILEI